MISTTIDNPKWSAKPNPILQAYTDILMHGNVLDLGGSDGVNAIYLAKKGFDVTSVDKDAEANTKLQTFAIENNLPIDVLNTDLNNFTIDSAYNNVISFYMFHFLKKEIGLGLLRDLKEKTIQGGVNIIIGFTDVGEFKVNYEKCYFTNDLLLKEYLDWDILLYKKFKASTMAKLIQQRAVLVARKR